MGLLTRGGNRRGSSLLKVEVEVKYQ